MTKLWLLKRTDRIWYDEYDSCVVAADTKEEARYTYPSTYYKYVRVFEDWKLVYNYEDSHPLNGVDADPGGWADPETLTVEYLGTTDRDIKGVVLASFNAG
jgi:hypothetical protein